MLVYQFVNAQYFVLWVQFLVVVFQHCKLYQPNSFAKYLIIAMVCEIKTPSISRTGIVPKLYFEQSTKNNQQKAIIASNQQLFLSQPEKLIY